MYISIEKACHMVCREGGYTVEDVLPMLSPRDRILFMWSII